MLKTSLLQLCPALRKEEEKRPLNEVEILSNLAREILFLLTAYRQQMLDHQSRTIEHTERERERKRCFFHTDAKSTWTRRVIDDL